MHKLRIIYDYHAQEAMREILPDVGCQDSLPLPGEIDKYMQLDDWVVLGAISKNANGEHCGIIKNRKHYKMVAEPKDSSADELDKYESLERKYKNSNKRHYPYRFGEAYEGDKPAKPWYKSRGIKILDKYGRTHFLEDKSNLVRLLKEEPIKLALFLHRDEEEIQ